MGQSLRDFHQRGADTLFQFSIVLSSAVFIFVLATLPAFAADNKQDKHEKRSEPVEPLVPPLQTALRLVEEAAQAEHRHRQRSIHRVLDVGALGDYSPPVPEMTGELRALSVGMTRLREAFLVQVAKLRETIAEKSAVRALLLQDEVAGLEAAADELASAVADVGDRRDSLAKLFKGGVKHPGWDSAKKLVDEQSVSSESDPGWEDLALKLRNAIYGDQASESKQHLQDQGPGASAAPVKVLSSSTTNALANWALGRWVAPSSTPAGAFELSISGREVVVRRARQECRATIDSVSEAQPGVLQVSANSGDSRAVLKLKKKDHNAATIWVESAPNECFKITGSLERAPSTETADWP